MGSSGPACDRMEWLDPFYKSVWRKAFADATPISGTFELTPRCNFACRMCYVHLSLEQMKKRGRELSAAEWLHIAEEARKAGTLWLCITGGEPLLHPEFVEIYRTLAQMGFFITLQTNASLIQGDIASLLEQYPPREVKVTLYGSNDAVYERVCRIPGGFTQTDSGIQTLKRLKIPIRLVSTVIRQNLEDLPHMARYAFENRLPWAASGDIKPSVRGADSEARSVSVREKEDEAARLRIHRFLKGTPFDHGRKPCTYCRDYRIGYWITWNGEMRFCGFMDEPHIPVCARGFSAAWKELLRYEEGLDWPEECINCEARGVCVKCAAVLEAESGSPQKVSGAFCERIKRIYREEKGM